MNQFPPPRPSSSNDNHSRPTFPSSAPRAPQPSGTGAPQALRDDDFASRRIPGNAASDTRAQDAEPSHAADQAASALGKSVKEGASHLAEGVKSIATEVATDAKKSAQFQLWNGKESAAEGLGSVADALRETGQALRRQEAQPFLTDSIEAAANKVRAASDYLQDRTLRHIVRDVEGFARREPALFLGGAFVVGILGGRFLKSSRATSPAGGENAPPMPAARASEARPVAQANPGADAQRSGAV